MTRWTDDNPNKPVNYGGDIDMRHSEIINYQCLEKYNHLNPVASIKHVLTIPNLCENFMPNISTIGSSWSGNTHHEYRKALSELERMLDAKIKEWEEK